MATELQCGLKLGDQVYVPASNFGEAYAREIAGDDWKNAMVTG